MRVFKSKSSEIRHRKIAGFDIETQTDNNNFRMGSVKSDKGHFVFWDCEKMIKYILRDLKGYWVYATNLDFDFFALFEKYLSKYPHEPIFRHKLLGVKIYSRTDNLHKKKEKPIYFLDTINYVPFGVATLGKIIGLTKLKTPSYISKPDITFFQEKEIEIYNIRDTEITYKFMLWFQEQLNNVGGELQITMAKTSLDIFQRKFFKDMWFHPRKWVNKFVREGYYGGRTETFVRGKVENLNYYDINSLYPSVMLKPLPNPNSAKYVKNADLHHVVNYEGMTKCKVKTPKKLHKPYLPYRDDSKLLFPLGEFYGTWTNFELREALHLGYEILEYQDAIIFTESKTYFKEYVETLYAERIKLKKERKPEELIFKLLLNTLYGKFGQQTSKDEWVHLKSEKAKNYKLSQIKEFVGDTYIRVNGDGKEAVFVHPIISAYVTAYARDKLYYYLMNYDVYYCDTDSVLTPDKIEHSTKLGEMKFESIINSGILVRPKFYMVNDSVKLKGARRIDIENFLKVIAGKPYKTWKFMKYKESIRRHMKVNQKLDITKEFDLEDTKRTWKNKFDPEIMEMSTPRILYKGQNTSNIDEKVDYYGIDVAYINSNSQRL